MYVVESLRNHVFEFEGLFTTAALAVKVIESSADFVRWVSYEEILNWYKAEFTFGSVFVYYVYPDEAGIL